VWNSNTKIRLFDISSVQHLVMSLLDLLPTSSKVFYYPIYFNSAVSIIHGFFVNLYVQSSFLLDAINKFPHIHK
jgi:hypothetical protein